MKNTETKRKERKKERGEGEGGGVRSTWTSGSQHRALFCALFLPSSVLGLYLMANAPFPLCVAVCGAVCLVVHKKCSLHSLLFFH